MINIYTTQNLTDKQFIRIRVAGPSRNLLFTTFTDLAEKPPYRHLKRETRLDIFERTMKDRKWQPDIVAAMIANVIIDAKQRRDDYLNGV